MSYIATCKHVDMAALCHMSYCVHCKILCDAPSYMMNDVLCHILCGTICGRGCGVLRCATCCVVRCALYCILHIVLCSRVHTVQHQPTCQMAYCVACYVVFHATRFYVQCPMRYVQHAIRCVFCYMLYNTLYYMLYGIKYYILYGILYYMSCGVLYGRLCCILEALCCIFCCLMCYMYDVQHVLYNTPYFI